MMMLGRAALSVVWLRLREVRLPADRRHSRHGMRSDISLLNTASYSPSGTH
jgi:hypothetical protein